ncbi:MAG: hypothetical protein U1F83_07020 [Verrucomicrobiota bacterium]
MTSNSKTILTILLCALAIAGSAAWVYWREFKAPQYDVELHQRVGEIMAEQTAKVAGPKGKVVVIAIPTGGLPELKTQLESFRLALKKLGSYELREYEMDTKDQDKYGVGTGLSGRRYVRTANKNLDAAAVVSFIGAPNMKDEDIAELQKSPKFVAEARAVDNLPKLFNKDLISVAVASRFSFPAPGPIQARTAQERFDKRYQIVAANNVTNIPKSE